VKLGPNLLKKCGDAVDRLIINFLLSIILKLSFKFSMSAHNRAFVVGVGRIGDHFLVVVLVPLPQRPAHRQKKLRPNVEGGEGEEEEEEEEKKEEKKRAEKIGEEKVF
jgi:hypothetical protein